MILMVTVDDGYGMAFNQRRQSRDRAVTQHIAALSARSALWVSPYSAALFADMPEAAPQLHVDAAFLSKAAPGEFAFAENVSVRPYTPRIERVILFRWNRRYPGDLFLDLDLPGPAWKLTSAQDFTGFSHEKISMEVYDHEQIH